MYKHVRRQVQVDGDREHVDGVRHDLGLRLARSCRLPHGAHIEGHLDEAVKTGRQQEISNGGLVE